MISIISLFIAIVVFTGTNQYLFGKINLLSTHIPSYIWENLTFLGDALAACAFLVLFIRKRPDLVWSGLIAGIIGVVIVSLLKAFFSMSRPPLVFGTESINIIGPTLYHHSFPSGHTVTIFIVSGILIFYFRSMIIKSAILLIAFSVGISRIAVGVHWPLDVLAGALIGSLCALTGLIIVKKSGLSFNRPAQITCGIILILLNSFLLIFYDTQYPQASYLKYFLAGVTLIIGIKEFFLLLKKSDQIA